MKSWTKTAIISLAVIFLLISAAIGAFNYFSPRMVAVHQKSVAQSIAQWGVEYSKIQSEADATKAVEMMEYISRYYATPHPGYKGTKLSEQNLEAQRALAISKLGAALEKWKRTQRTAEPENAETKPAP